MKRITKIEIENFQSHKHTVVEPGQGVTVIVGHSDSGKSAFIRAVKWCLYNKAPFSPLINKDAKSATVTIAFDDGTVIVRHKSDKDNVYSVTANGETKTFSSVGNQPLKEVMDATGMHEVDMFNRQISLNMVEQFDNLFFISENATDRGTLVSQMAQTEVCDNAIALCSTEINAVKRMVTSLSKSLKDEKIKLSSFSHVEDLGRDIENMKQTKQAADDLLFVMQRLKDSVTSSKLARDRLLTIRIPNIPDSQIESTQQSTDTLLATKQLMEKISAYLVTFKTTAESIRKYEDILLSVSENDVALTVDNLSLCEENKKKADYIRQTISRINISAASLGKSKITDEDIVNLNGLATSASDLLQSATKQSSLSEMLKRIKTAEGQIITWQSLIDRRSQEAEKAKEQYTKMLKESGTCPVCGSVIDDNHIHAAVEIIDTK